MISPFFFIFQQKNMQQHLSAVVSTAAKQGFNISGEFWRQYANWHVDISEKITCLLKGTQRAVNSKLLLLQLRLTDMEKINSLWLNPLVNSESQYFDQKLLSVLLQVGLLSLKRERTGLLYVCDEILSMYEQLDLILLSGAKIEK